MNSSLKAQLLALYQEFQAHDRQQVNRLDRWRNVEPESALFLSILVRSKQAKRILEIGTSNGYSTLWLADAVEATGGHLISLEVEPSRSLQAQHYLREFHLAQRVDCLTVDAGLFLDENQSVYDLIFLDAERSAYVSYWPALKQLLAAEPGSSLVVDNVISHQQEVADLLSLIDSDSSMLKSILPLGAGLLLVTLA